VINFEIFVEVWIASPFYSSIKALANNKTQRTLGKY
jgi:hypothetical protein